MLSGPKVDIYVGEDKNHYNLPKELLCYYSKYFERCFNGAFREAQEQKLELLEDKAEDFEVLVEYMLHGSIPDITQGLLNNFVSRYMGVIAYAERFAMGDIFGELLCEKLEKALLDEQDSSLGNDFLTPARVELIFRVIRRGHPLRILAAKHVLSCHGIEYQSPLHFENHESEFRELESANGDFAYEILQQIRWGMVKGNKWIDPLTKDRRKYYGRN